MEFNYDDAVKNYQAKYFKNLGYSDQDILGILGDLPSTDTGGGATPQLVDQLGRGGDNNPYSKTASSPGVRSQDDYSMANTYGLRQAQERDFYDTDTAANKFMDNYPDYYNTNPEQSKFQQMISGAANFIPGMGMAKRGLDALGNMLPVNRRGILENELLGAGVMLDDIGRVVSNDYNSAEGIMAGYNANKIDYGTFDKRRETIANTLATKYNMSQADIDAAIAGTYEGEVETDLIDRLGYLNTAQTNIFNPKNVVANQMVQQQEAERAQQAQAEAMARAQNISRQEAVQQQAAIERDNRGDSRPGGGGGFSDVSSNTSGPGGAYNEGNYCFDPSTPIQMADGSTKEIKNIQLGDYTKGGEVTGVFQFKASDEIHDYKGVTVAGSHYVKEDGKFIMVKDSPLSVKIDKIPVVYSLDTSGRRIFIKDIEFADYNGDGVAKNFLNNAGVDLSGFDKEVLRQVEQRLL